MKRIISIALVLILIISLLPMTSLKALAADVNEGDGSVENPWLITNEADYVLHIFNSTFESGHYKLTEDIVLDAATGDDTANGNQNGSSTGRVINIDLNGHTICAVGGNYRFFSCGAEGELTLKNGSVIVDRTYENSFGAVFNILDGGKLTLENMDVSEIGKVAYEKNGELLYVAAGSSAVIKNTVMEADTEENKNENTVYIAGKATFDNAVIDENVYVTAAADVTLSGGTQIANVILPSGATVTPDGLTSGANICVRGKQNAAFTKNGMADYAAYFRTTAEGMTVAADANGALTVMPPDELADGDGLSAENPIYLRSEADWYTYLRSSSGIVYKNRNTRKVYYFKVTANIVLDAATGEDTVAATTAHSVTGTTTVIDFNKHTVTAIGGTSRFISAGADTSLTMRNGYISIDRDCKTDGGVFNVIDGGKLQLENMVVTEQGDFDHSGKGELIFAADGACGVTLTDTVLQGDFTNSTGTAPLYIIGTSQLVMNGGKIIGDSTRKSLINGGAVTIGTNAFLTINGGEIVGGSATKGGAVYSNGTVVINGGTIHSGTATEDGAAVYCNAGKLTLNGNAVIGSEETSVGSLSVSNSAELYVGADYTGTAYVTFGAKHLETPVYGKALTGCFCEGAFPGTLYLEGGYDLPRICGKADGSLTVQAISVVNGDDVSWYNEDEIITDTDGYAKLYTGGTLRLGDGSYRVDLNGQNVSVMGTGNTKVTGMDSANADYATYGKLTVDAVQVVNSFRTDIDGVAYYMLTTEEGAYTFHQLGMQITKVSLRTKDASGEKESGIYYWADWDCDSALAARIKYYGIACSVKCTPDAVSLQETMSGNTDYGVVYTKVANSPESDGIFADTADGDTITSAMVKNILSPETRYTEAGDILTNDACGNMAIYAAPYVVFDEAAEDTVVVDEKIVGYTLYEIVQEIHAQQILNKEYYAQYETLFNEWLGYWKGIPETTFNDDTLNILMVGNSFCYYYVEELYALFAENMPEGIKEVKIYNLYYSGCKLHQHLKWWQENSANYYLYLTDQNGRVRLGEAGAWTLEAALAQENWDYISLQDSSSTLASNNVDAAMETAIEQAGVLLNRFHTLYPDVQLLWHRTWSYEVGRVTDSTVFTEELVALHYQNMEIFTQRICERYADLSLMPVKPGVAWKKARELADGTTLLPPGGLCARLGISSHISGVSHSGDGYHDGDIGGGQLLNAYVWYMTLTGNDISQSEYVPVYNYRGVEYKLSQEFVAMLKEAAKSVFLQ